MRAVHTQPRVSGCTSSPGPGEYPWVCAGVRPPQGRQWVMEEEGPGDMEVRCGMPGPKHSWGEVLWG